MVPRSARAATAALVFLLASGCSTTRKNPGEITPAEDGTFTVMHTSENTNTTVSSLREKAMNDARAFCARDNKYPKFVSEVVVQGCACNIFPEARIWFRCV